MSNWVSITIDTLYEASVAALIDACDSAALAEGQANRAAGLIQGVVDDVRLKVASCASNRVDEDVTTVPKGLRDLTVDLITARLKKAVQIDLTADERDGVTRHERRLNRVADCKERIDTADTPVAAEVDRQGTIETVVSTTRQTSREKLSGL